jgi:hypothetical protein
MEAYRDIKRNARRTLHDIMSVPALYLASRLSTGILVHVRFHNKFIAATSFLHGPQGLVSMNEGQPKIIFMRSELNALGITLARNAIISFEVDEAYNLDSGEENNDITVEWYVTPLIDGAAAGLATP